MEGVLFTEYDWHTLDAGLATEAVRLIVPILVIAGTPPSRSNIGG